MIKAAFLMPHPPILLETVGKGAEKECEGLIAGLNEIAQQIKAIAPKTIIVITPHGPVFSDGIAIGYDDHLQGDLTQFGFPEVSIEKENSKIIVDKIIYESSHIDVPCLKLNDANCEYFNISKSLDHGVIVPLKFVDEHYSDYKLIHITYGLFSSHKLYEFGRILKKCASIEDVVVIASGDMSHCLSNDGPYEYHPSGLLFDQKIRQILEEKDILSAMFFDDTLLSESGECGKRSIDIMLGSLDGYDFTSKTYGYDGPFGVGYLAMGFEYLIKDESRLFTNQINNQYNLDKTVKLSKESHFVKLARRSIEKYLGMIDDIMYDELPAEMFEAKAGTFVSLKKHGALRGCIGTIGPTEDNVALEIVANAVKAAFEDPRFPLVESDELDDITITVDVLLQPEPVKHLSELDTKVYGVIVSSDYKRGLLLPNLEGVDTVEEQIRIACQKGSISEDEDYQIEKFEVIRYY